jgi:hypothetical protein
MIFFESESFSAIFKDTTNASFTLGKTSLMEFDTYFLEEEQTI